MNEFITLIDNLHITEEKKEKENDRSYDPFNIFDEIINDDEMKKNINDNIRLKKLKNYNIILCSDCQGLIINTHRGFECEECGKIEDFQEVQNFDIGSNDMANGYNTSGNSAAPIRIIGPNAYAYEKMLVCKISNYKKTQCKNTIDQIINCVEQHKGPTPPKSVVLESAELYYKVQQFCIKRGNVRKGCMAACMYRTCIKYGINRKPGEISDIFGVPQSELSNGEKILDELVSNGSITISETLKDEDQMTAFINRYFESLNIINDESGYIPVGRPNYKEFVNKLVKFVQKYRIAESSIMSSKCVGSIFILINGRKEFSHINNEKIESECKISKSTFNRFAKHIKTVLSDKYVDKDKKDKTEEDENKIKIQSRLRHLFKKYNIAY